MFIGVGMRSVIAPKIYLIVPWAISGISWKFWLKSIQQFLSYFGENQTSRQISGNENITSF